ncbi:MAG: TraX family protein [Eubacteriales bacterium]|nr:TraX family protein [Eubacteriales bacterium]
MLENLEKLRVHLPPLDAGWLKKFAVLIMVIDHVTYAFLERVYTADGRAILFSISGGKLLDSIGRAVGRQAFPIFCFFLVEGFLHTRSRLRYFGRLVFFAALSQYPFQKAFFPRSDTLHANVLVTMALGFLSIWILEELGNVFLKEGEGPVPAEKRNSFKACESPVLAEKQDSLREGERPASAEKRDSLREYENPAPVEKRDSGSGGERDGTGQGRAYRSLFYRFCWLFAGSGAVFGFCSLANMLHSDYRYGGVLTIVLLYLFYKYRITSLCVSWAWLSWYNRLELYSAPAFYLLACYNGKRGKQSKYFFYVFYPAHLLVLWLLRRHFFGL